LYRKLKQILCLLTPPPLSGNGAVYEIMLKNVVEPGGRQGTTGRMRTALWATTATDTGARLSVTRTLPLLYSANISSEKSRLLIAINLSSDFFHTYVFLR
jgi:hypothetical protein